MTGYKLNIADEGRHSLETILEIQDLNAQKRSNNWNRDDIKTVIGPIYTVGSFETYNSRSKQKKVPAILKSRAFEEKVLALIVEDNVRYIDMTIDGWNIKFYTRNPKHYKYEYYLNFSENRPVIIPT